MDNPWLKLPKHAPFIAPCDVNALNELKYKLNGLRFDAFPEPYCGDINTAKVVCLLLNPGFDEGDITTNFENHYWTREIRTNLEHRSECPFLYLSPKVQETGGYKWWTAMLRPLEKAGVTSEELAQGIMSIQFLPYHSKKYTHNKQYIPSQYYQFHLVRQAMALRKTIIIMRSKAYWVEAIPELAHYQYLLELNNPRRVYVSQANLDNKNGNGTFDQVVATLRLKRRANNDR